MILSPSDTKLNGYLKIGSSIEWSDAIDSKPRMIITVRGDAIKASVLCGDLKDNERIAVLKWVKDNLDRF
jgi:hypothetical protein